MRVLKEGDRLCEIRWGIQIPLRDGVRLSATAYVPIDQKAPTECIVALTPYISDSHHDRGVRFAAAGMAFFVVDVRGRGNSEGEFRPYLQEAADGYDVVEWLATQPCCNGKVAMWGGSYLGYAQWVAAKENPPHLVTIVPAAAPHLGTDFPMRSNIFFPYVLQWLFLTNGRASQTRIFSDKLFWNSFYRHWYESGRAFRDMDGMLQNPSAIFQEWLSHPEPDTYWDTYNPSAQEYARITLPVLSITGSYDDDQIGALEHYRQHMRNADAATRAQHYLIIGPWNHGGTVAPKSEFGGLKLGSASLLDLHQLQLEWYAWTMRNGPRPEFLKKAVAYYVMGAERWRYAESLEAVTERHQAFFLDSSANATDVFCAGVLGEEIGRGRADSYTYDPRELRGPEIRAESMIDAESVVDQSLTFALRGRQLIYHSAPFEEDVEVSGFFKLAAWVSIDCPDTDLYVSIYDVMPDGTCIRLSSDAIRARYREGLRTSKLIETRDPLPYTFNQFTFISRRIESGHRLRLVIAPMGRLTDSNFAQRNFNVGAAVAEQSIDSARAVTVTLFHDESYPSALYVPIAAPEPCDEIGS